MARANKYEHVGKKICQQSMTGHNIPDEIARRAMTMNVIIGTSSKDKINMSTWEKNLPTNK
jgi:hypothetical protein